MEAGTVDTECAKGTVLLTMDEESVTGTVLLATGEEERTKGTVLLTTMDDEVGDAGTAEATGTVLLATTGGEERTKGTVLLTTTGREELGRENRPRVQRPRVQRAWTALPGVKIAGFALAIILCCLAINRIAAIDLRHLQTAVPPEIMFVDLPSNEYFFNQHMDVAYYNAIHLTNFKSEEAISSGDHLEWLDTEDGIALMGKTASRSQYAWLFDDLDTPERREMAEQAAIREQLDSFRQAQAYLDGAEGLVYHLRSDPITVIPGSIGADAGWFRSQPVFYVRHGNTYFDSSHSNSFGEGFFYNSYFHNDQAVIYLAYTSEPVAAQNDVYLNAQREYIEDMKIIAGSAAVLVALFVILLLGTGRRYGNEDRGVHFTLIDRPFLDISLAVLLGWTALIASLAMQLNWTLRRHQNYTAMNVLYTGSAALIAAPALLWFLSFIKRVKAGKFWRHTLVFYFPSRFIRFAKRYAKALWCGMPLTGKVGLISFGSFVVMLFVGIVGYNSYQGGGILIFLAALILSAAVAYLLLRYAQRIYALEQGALKASGGAYEGRIDAGGGELGKIADSINNIAEGINTAVEQRMKSERLKTELITNVSHDIRTPLTSIITYTDLLKNEGLDCDKAPEYLDILIKKSQRLKTLTDELFEAAKAATGNINVNITELDPASLISQVLGELDGAIKSSGLDMRIDLAENLLVKADGKLMWRVMENLLSNVFKYSLAGSRVYLSAQKDGSSVRIDLKNISAMELNIDPDELTERFKRGDDSRADGSSGLGLSIVQSFVVAQGGRFSISIDGDLFKATVYLPSSAY